MFLLIDGEEVAQAMGPGELVVVPQDTWHRFETPDGVKVVSVTPQPTDHQVDRPADYSNLAPISLSMSFQRQAESGAGSPGS